MDSALEKHRKCRKCGRDRVQSEYVKTKSKFFLDGYSTICVECLEKMIDSTDLAQVDKLLQWLDLPLIVDHWTRIWRQAKEQTLRYYLNTLDTCAHYSSLDWKKANDIWKESVTEQTLVDHIDGANNAWLLQMSRKWPSEMERTAEDFHYLEDLYADLTSTQNLITATQRDDAKRLCEVGLLINKKIRAGLDAKKEMDRHICPCKISLIAGNTIR